MIRRRGFILFGLLLVGLFLSGCPKKIPEPGFIKKPSAENEEGTTPRAGIGK